MKQIFQNFLFNSLLIAALVSNTSIYATVEPNLYPSFNYSSSLGLEAFSLHHEGTIDSIGINVGGTAYDAKATEIIHRLTADPFYVIGMGWELSLGQTDLTLDLSYGKAARRYKETLSGTFTSTQSFALSNSYASQPDDQDRAYFYSVAGALRQHLTQSSPLFLQIGYQFRRFALQQAASQKEAFFRSEGPYVGAGLSTQEGPLTCAVELNYGSFLVKEQLQFIPHIIETSSSEITFDATEQSFSHARGWLVKAKIGYFVAPGWELTLDMSSDHKQSHRNAKDSTPTGLDFTAISNKVQIGSSFWF